MEEEPRARVWIIGSDQWPRAYLRAELIERGYDAVGYVTLREAVLELTMFPARRPRLIVLDLHDQLEDEKVVAALLRRGVPVIALAGATEAAQPDLAALPWAAFLRRPITIGAVADTVVRLAGSRPW